jgi:hypothetical protein
MNGRRILGLLCLASLPVSLWCAETANSPAGSVPSIPAASATDLESLKQRIAEQQEQIKKLQQAMDEQQRLLERSLQNLAGSPAGGQVATGDGTPVERAATTNVAGPVRLVPALNLGGRPSPLNAAPRQVSSSDSKNPCEKENASPTFIRLGNTCIVPIGFMDLTSVWRDKNAGSSLGSNFGSLPYNTSVNAQNSEFRFTPQNSRLGVRVDGDWKGTHFIGYNEFDFLGTGAGTNYTVTNGAFVPRLRLFWVDVRKGKMEFLAGQSWSMLTPNRKGISALPGDLFYSQVIDVNYMAGLTWTRQPGVRVLFHPNKTATFGVSFENPDQYIGGSAGGSGITLPTALAGLASTQLDNAPNIAGGTNTVLATPTVHPDIIAKIAFDPSSRFHFEVAGIERTFKIWNPLTAPAAGAGQHFTKVGGGVQVGINAEVVKNFRLITTNYFSDGGGRYLFGQAPDVIVRSDGSLSAVRASGTVDGFEATVKNTLLYAYYGGIYIGRNVTLDTNGKPVGYGFTGSAPSQNRAIQEVTLGFNQTMWKNPKYGAINFMGQYEYLTRDPWFVALGTPKATHDNTIYFNLRYTLPGSIPTF